MSSRCGFFLLAAVLGTGAFQWQQFLRAELPTPGPAEALRIGDVRVHEFAGKDDPTHKSQFVEVLAESELSGWGGPISPEMGPSTAAMGSRKTSPK